MALSGSERAGRFSRLSPAGAIVRGRAFLADSGHAAIAGRMAGGAFLIRVASAAIAYLSTVLLARWMGTHEFGVYVYVWTWVLLIGGLFDLGLAQSAQRFIPEYAERAETGRLRGFLAGSRWLAAGAATLAAVVCAGLVLAARPYLDQPLVMPLLLACLCLPVYALTGVQEGIGRAYNRLALGMLPPYVLRPLLLLVLMAVAYAAGFAPDATTAMLAAVGATWLAAIAQLVALDRHLARTVPRGPKTYDAGGWLKVSLPIFLVESFYLLLTYTDILVLKQFHSGEEVAVYFAAAKTLALVAFVNFSVAAAVAHRFTEYHVSGDRERLAAFLAQSIRWTFWASLAATSLILALGLPFLALFGPEYLRGYPIMFVLAVGLMARAAVGPVERLLNMLGEQNVCAGVHAAAFALNLAGCLVLVPAYGAMGAAASTAFALTIESVLLFLVTRRRLGLHVFILRR